MNLPTCNDTRPACKAKRGSFCLALAECYPDGKCPFYKTVTQWTKEIMQLQKDGHPIYATTVQDEN